ncbi:MAG: hypothetical protein A2509_08510 [Candidatus Edwardsbacteria bacterium RIFOXYD12_FULL_50_11]|uniref:Uncharacterized protein n=1 Tax=Candidatus Edwardsbacteria bacterium GWF2_54_11 TaxID=1817851 RepID=A0A1F5RES4_9BACT|nr:MAG: hypothetical protein A2502_01880 [Candidatus Edwardsbacteria bacterium RifOxyC12_full_54_24]OGF09015.1 MAG: hypothetical protein A2273_10335 [Candidatus Edwardsbacteria bacterium RifOxyA12_full_54_48]OGF12902.1 MAG: hypothetical protein A2024_11790 [Candidatus Edwardsbacteria bacterium GWF2_54_11]OGF17437.1 MAG: hypothetical protein A2509_08510 [Candidatus Edwardsbacteria bacterium RIFOXYD12_FULL_50_11]OGJ17716.1 MAG: hypothetical protein A2349_02400 [Candidatus Edwardsbacteria bacteriu
MTCPEEDWIKVDNSSGLVSPHQNPVSRPSTCCLVRAAATNPTEARPSPPTQASRLAPPRNSMV